MTLDDLKKMNLPDGPGVYFFRKSALRNGAADSAAHVSSDSDTRGTAAELANAASSQILYIGKATSLRERVRSYFNDDLIKTRGRLLVDMMVQAETITFQETDSVLEAFILESELIKKYQPYYNTKEKDNKSFNYVVITKEDFPRVLVVRGRNLEKAGMTAKEQRENLGFEYTDVFGPFPFGAELREAMKLIRRIFPFRDKCEPFVETVSGKIALAEGDAETVAAALDFTPQLSSDGAHVTITGKKGRPCFNRAIGLCPGVCTGEISKEEYAEQVAHIRKFFKGKKQEVVDDLKNQMHEYAAVQKFEEAGEVKRTIVALTHIQDISMIKKDAEFGHVGARGKRAAKKGGVGAGAVTADFSVRAEAYDVAHLSGKDMVGVMVVMEDAEFAKHEYKKFNIKEIKSSNDTGALKQMLDRRFNHPDWPMPTHIVIDGGVGQINAAEEILTARGITGVTLVAVTKDDKHKAKEILRSKKFKGGESVGVANAADEGVNESADATHQDEASIFDDGDIISINQECHRFAIATHRKRRSLSRGF